MYIKLKGKFPKSNIVVTLEDKGALYCVDDQIKVMPGIKTDVKDTTGAGDIFHGAYVYGLTNNFTLEKTITYANITAGLSTMNYGGRLSIPALNEVINYYNQKFPPQVSQPNATASNMEVSEPKVEVVANSGEGQNVPNA